MNPRGNNNKLSLSNKKKLHPNMDYEYYPPPNQEMSVKDDEPFDFDLDLTKTDETNDKTDDVNPMKEHLDECASNIRSLMDERHDVAKNRERLLYQMKVPNVKDDWLQVKAYNEFVANDEDDTKKFREFWRQIVWQCKSDMANKLIEYMDREITIKNANMQKCRDEAFKAYPKATKGWSELKLKFDESIKIMKVEYNQQLAEFIKGIPTMCGNNETKSSRGNFRSRPRARGQRRFFGGKSRAHHKPY